MDRDELRRLAALAVQQFAGMEPGRPVGGTYYLYRTLRQLDLDDLAAAAHGAGAASGARSGRASSPTASPARSTRRGSQELRELVEEEIRRRLVADRGVEAMARTLRKPLARRHRVHARVARGDAGAAAGGLPARRVRWPRASRSAAGDATAGTSTSARPSARRCRTAVCRRSRSSGTRTRRSPRSWSSPTSPGRSRASPGSR